MNIRINDWEISSDNLNLILSKIKTRKSGKYEGDEYTEVVGFYGTLNLVFDAIIKKSMIESEITKVVQLKKEYEKFLIDFENATLELKTLARELLVLKDE